MRLGFFYIIASFCVPLAALCFLDTRRGRAEALEFAAGPPVVDTPAIELAGVSAFGAAGARASEDPEADRDDKTSLILIKNVIYANSR